MAEYDIEKTKEGLKKALEFAKANPDHPDSVELRRRIESGQLNFELKALGKPPVPIKTPKIDMGAAMAAANTATDVQTKMPEKAQSMKRDDAGSDIKEGFKELQQVGPKRIQAASEDIKNMGDFETFGQGGFGVLAQGVGAFLDTAGIAAKTAAKVMMTPDQEAQWMRGLEKLAANPAIKTTTDLVAGAIDSIRESDPELASSIGDALTLSELLGMSSKPVTAGVKATVDAGKEAITTIPKIADAGQSMMRTGAREAGQVLDETLASRRASQLIKQEEKVNEAVKRIIQGSPEDLAAARRSLMELDTSEVKTYSDLSEAVNTRISALSRAVDAELDKFPEKFQEDQLAKYTKVGDRTVIQTPVQDALDGLEDAYTKSGDLPRAELIRQMREKMQSEGLTVKDVNAIAREYGIEFRSRAFDKMGNVKEGYNAEAFENIRKGLKDVVRERLPNDIAKELDAKMSDLYDTQQLIDAMEERVYKQVNALPPESPIRRALARSLGFAVGAVDIATGRLVSSVLRQIVQKAGVLQKTRLSPMEIEAQLEAQLKEIEKLLDMKKAKADSNYEKVLIGSVVPRVISSATARPSFASFISFSRVSFSAFIADSNSPSFVSRSFSMVSRSSIFAVKVFQSRSNAACSAEAIASRSIESRSARVEMRSFSCPVRIPRLSSGA